jgi:hypothetical protein
MYLLGAKRIPKHSPDFIGIGDEREAIACAHDAIEIWLETPGALEWLFNMMKKTMDRQQAGPAAQTSR